MTYPGIENDQALLETMNPDFIAVETRRKEREAEYGEWVAVQDIPWGAVKAAVPGSQIPRDNVRRLKWDELGLVARRESPEGREVINRTRTWLPGERERWEAEAKAAEKPAEKAAADKAPKGGAN